MLPVVLSEGVVELFKFYRDGMIREGMRYSSELYGLASQFPAANRLKGYQLACELAESGTPVVVTASEERYVIWLSLRSPAYTQQSSTSLSLAN